MTWGGKEVQKGLFPQWMRDWLGPLLLMVSTFPFAFTMVYANTTDGTTHGLDGSLVELVKRIIDTRGAFVVEAFHATWPTGDDASEVVKILVGFCVFQLLLVRLTPGKEYRGPVSPKGHTPVYTENGLLSFVIAVAAFYYTVVYMKWYSALKLLKLYPALLCTMSVVSLVFCLALYVKGVYAPSGPDCESSGNFVLDYYGGRELYPRVFGWDVKQFTNCRFGMMAWGLLPMAFVAGTMEAGKTLTYGQIVNLVIQVIYVTKFFAWECGYFDTIDIMHDKAGYYICWGCLVWVPSVYVVHSYFISQQVMAGTYVDLTQTQAILVIIFGALMVWMNYDADLQRKAVREADGKCTVWGAPPKIVRAKYRVDGSNKDRNSILLASGYWGISSHFHYVPEILAALCWSLPGGTTHIMPYFYVIFLTILLTDRAFRDDAKCKAKYGKYWDEYRKIVPYKIIPGVI